MFVALIKKRISSELKGELFHDKSWNFALVIVDNQTLLACQGVIYL